MNRLQVDSRIKQDIFLHVIPVRIMAPCYQLWIWYISVPHKLPNYFRLRGSSEIRKHQENPKTTYTRFFFIRKPFFPLNLKKTFHSRFIFVWRFFLWKTTTCNYGLMPRLTPKKIIFQCKQNLLKNRNWILPVVRHFKWKLEFVSNILWMTAVRTGRYFEHMEKKDFCNQFWKGIS